MCRSEKDEMPFEILAYLTANPEAQDTVEGVAEWWLLEQQIKNQTAAVKIALDDLVSRGFMLEHRGKDNRTHYRVNSRKRRQISKIIEMRAWPRRTRGSTVTE
jgi:hypothetical protein